jgi:hypothetical protein
MTSIFADYVEKIIEFFMNDFTIHGNSLDACLENLMLYFEKMHEN